MNLQMDLFSAAETSEHLPFERLLPQLREAFAQGALVPNRHHHRIETEDGSLATLLVMPAWHHAARPRRYLGVKLVTVFPNNTKQNLPGLNSTYLLYDGLTGVPLASLDGNVITSRRTVAASALAASYLARRDARKLLVLGAGRVASLIPAAYCAVRPIDEIAVWDINIGYAERLVRDIEGLVPAVTIVKDLEAAVAKADIVSSATLAITPLILGKWLKAGTHVDLIGAFTPEMREIDDEGVARASVYVDTIEALYEAGDLVQPTRSGVFDKKTVCGTLSELCYYDCLARKSEDEITLFKAVGTALADLAAASMAYESRIIV